MAQVVIIGGGVVGLGLGMMLAADGHEVVELERDAGPPPATPEDAWESWDRTGVNQFRLPHLLLARYRQIAEAELPRVAAALERDGAVRFDPLADAPDSITGGRRPDDDRFVLLSGRRAVAERAVASVAEDTAHLTVRRGVAVNSLLTATEAVADVPHVVGVRTADGEELRADLVVDCGGRRSSAPNMLAAIGARRPPEQLDDSGFIYLGRHYRARDGKLPPPIGPPLQEWGSISTLALPADNATWTVAIIARSADRPLLGLRDNDRWEKVVRSLPTVAHWIDAEPIEPRIVPMTKIEDRHRDFCPGGVPVATGLVALSDAWACTNPSVGRGVSIGTMHAQALRDTLRSVGTDRPGELAQAFAAATAETVQPWYDSTVSFDRHRLAEMEAIAEGRDYSPDDPAFEISKALNAASMRDPDVLRASIDIGMVLELPETVLARPGLMDTVIELGAGWRDEPSFGPSREELLAMASA